MKTKSNRFVFAKEQDWELIDEGISRQIMAYDGQIMMVKVKFEQGAIGCLHQHFHSQVCYVERGRFEVTIGDQTKLLVAGDSFYVAPDCIHGVLCVESGMLLDVFAPMRIDFLSPKSK